jgi:excisionase family DNA binding protein
VKREEFGMATDRDTLLTAREAAAEQHISIDTIKKALRNKHLHGHKVGTRGDWRISRQDFAEWIAAGGPTAKEETEERR